MEEINNLFPNFFRRVRNKWINIVHKKREFGDIYDACIQILYPERFSSSPPDESIESDFADNVLRSIILDNVFIYDKSLKMQYTKTFPGGIPSVLMKKLLKYLKNNYVVSFKSDGGVRVMFLSLYVSRFPRWEKKLSRSKVNEKNKEFALKQVSFSLEDNCAIETSVKFLETNKQKSLSIFLYDNVEFLLEIDPSSKKVILIDKEFKKIELIRKVGKVLNYICDKNFQFYLLLENYYFPIFKKNEVYSYQNVVLMDGDITFNLKDKKLDFLIFDIITFCEPTKVISCLNYHFQKKMEIVKEKILLPFNQFYSMNVKYTKPKILRLLRKEYFPKSELGNLLKKVEHSKENNEFCYENTYKIDGLVFIPKDEILYKYESNLMINLFKWKFFEKNYVVFLLFPQIGESNDRMMLDSESYVRMKYLLRNSYFDYKSDYVDVKSLSSKEKRVLEFENGSICLCNYSQNEEESSGKWNVIKVFKEFKLSGYYFKQICTVLQNKIENISQIEIQKSLKGIKFYEEQKLVTEYVKRVKKNNKLIVTRINIIKRYKMECQIRHISRGNRSNNSDIISWERLKYVNECTGPDFSFGSKLETFVYDYIQENQKFNCVQMIYIPTGVYQIIGFCSDEILATSKNFLENLQAMVDIITALRKTKTIKHNREENQDSNEENLEKKRKIQLNTKK